MMNTALEYSTRVVQEGGRRCKKSTLNDLVHLTPLRIPLMNLPKVIKIIRIVPSYNRWRNVGRGGSVWDVGVICRGSTAMGPMYFAFCRLYPSPPQTPTPVLRYYMSSLYSSLTLYRRWGLAYSKDWRGFVGAKKKTSVSLLVFNSSMEYRGAYKKYTGQMYVHTTVSYKCLYINKLTNTENRK